ncbi:MAG TPA: rhombosortase [Gammaproteobacteria bacterium]|nr:rhombosortase [Gammaproteobacteria bacterium]
MNTDLSDGPKFPERAWWRRWSVVLLIAACCVALALGGEPAREWARYDRIGLENGELWRLLTGHLVHLGFGHLWPNLLALVVIGSLFEDVLEPVEWLAAAVGCALAIDLGLYALDSDVDWYVGLSGVLHGFVACGALLLLLRRRQRIGAALAIGLGAKLAWEHWAGPVPFTAASVGGPVIVAAHLYGAAAGVVAALAFLGRRRARL